MCDILYYLYIYFIPAIIYTSLNVNLINFKNIFRLPYFCIQFICDEKIASEIFHIFKICNVPNFKYMYRYSIGNVQQIYVYINNIDEVSYSISVIEEICKLKFNNIKFVIDQISYQVKLDDYFLLYVIFSTIFAILLRYSYYIHNRNNYIYFITSIIMLINSLIFYSNHICFKHNLVFPLNLYKFSDHFIHLVVILMLLYIIDITFIWLNIKKNNLYEKN